MRYLLFFFLLFSTVANAQLTQKQLKELEEGRKKLDTINANLNASINASIQRMDSVNRVQSNEQMARNMDRFMVERKEQEKKAKRGAYIRIGIGVLLFIVLIIGLRRKKKQQADL